VTFVADLFNAYGDVRIKACLVVRRLCTKRDVRPLADVRDLPEDGCRPPPPPPPPAPLGGKIALEAEGGESVLPWEGQ